MTLFDQVKDRLDLAFDPSDLETKYQFERDRRVRTDTDRQFIDIAETKEHEDKYHHDDPHMPVQHREAEAVELDFLIVGGGWVGMVAAARLKQSGYSNIRILDGAGDFGGVWYWNRYPGAQCDIQSYIYLPLLEETGYMPKERYSHAPEIFAYAQRLGRHFDLYDVARFHTWVSEMRWEENDSRWVVTTSRGDIYRSKYALVGTGSASRARLPDIPGLEDFTGETFHTSRWNYDFTGGGPSGGLQKLEDKRVAVIGTGASAVQVIPHIAASAKRTYVFQRTPSVIGERSNAPTDPDWFSSLKPGWQDALRQEFERALEGEPVTSPALQTEGFLEMSRNANKVISTVDPDGIVEDTLEEATVLADHMTMERLRSRVDHLVKSKERAEVLKPWYSYLCKRPTFHDEYLQAFNRPTVSLIDVADSKGVERITETGIVANGVEHDVDGIVFASGFEITSDFEKRMGIPIFGEEGKSLYEHWGAGMRTLHGIMSNGFPNLFIIGGLFTNTISPNYCTPIDGQVRHVVHLVDQLEERGALSAQPSEAAERDFMALQIDNATAASMRFGGTPETCTPGYYNQEGKALADRRDSRLETYPLGGEHYWKLLKKWRDAGNLAGLEVITEE